MESQKKKRSYVRERIRRIARSADRFDSVVVKVVVGTLLALIVFIAGYYLIG